MTQNEVAIAFDIVLEELEDTIAALNIEGARAFEKGEYETARDLSEKGSQITAFREKVNDLRKEWLNIFAAVPRPKRKKRRRKTAERLKRGLRTPEDEFRIPILESLIELGGSAPISEVVSRVEEKMKDRLNTYDRSPLPSDPTQMRWRNTAQWTRSAMVREGLLSPNSPRGVWEITQAGRKLVEGVNQQNGEVGPR